MAIQDLIVSQFMTLLKSSGVDPTKMQAMIVEAVNDIRAMKLSQDRTEAMVRSMYITNFPGQAVKDAASTREVEGVS